MELSRQHRRFFIVHQCAIPVVMNFAINVVITWVVNYSAKELPLWGKASIAPDLLFTAFILPFLSCIFATAQIKKQVRLGKIQPLPPGQLLSRWLRHSSWMRALFLGIAGVIFGAIPLVWALSLGQAKPFPLLSFVLFKGVWAAMLAFLVSPIIAWWALATISPRKT